MAFALPALPIIAALGSAGGALATGVSASNAASYQAQVEKNNAIIANQNATRALAAGQQQTQQESLKSAAQGGAIKVAQAANGVDVNSGSNVDVQASQREIGELDSEETLNKAQLEAYGYRVAATSDTGQANLEENESSADLIGGGLGAAGALGGASKYLGGLGPETSGVGEPLNILPPQIGGT